MLRKTVRLAFVTIFTAAIAGLILVQAAPEDERVWTRIGPEGGVLFDIVMDPLTPANLYVIGYALFGGDVFKSTDGGESWIDVSSTLTGTDTFSIAIDPITPTTLYVGGWYIHEVHKSTDGGLSWEYLSDLPGNVLALAVDPVTSTIVYANSGGALQRSIDGGESWNPLTMPVGDVITFDPVTPSILYTSKSNLIYQSLNNGDNWSQAGAAVPDWVKDLVIDPLTPTTWYAGTSSNGVFKSLDSGAHWITMSTGLTNTHIVDLAIDPVDSSILYVGTIGLPSGPTDGVFKSDNGGATWVALDTGIVQTEQMKLAINRLNHDVFVTTNDGLLKSVTQGAEWHPANSGMYANHINELVFDPLMPGLLYGASPKRVSKSTNAGLTWATTGLTGGATTWTASMAIDPITPTTLYVGGPDVGLYRSFNAGETWDTANAGLPNNAGVCSIAINPTTSTTLYAAVIDPVSEIFVSSNSGSNWVTATVTGMAPATCQLVIDPVTPTILYASAGVGVSRSDNGGQSWNAVNTGLPGSSVYDLVIDPLLPATLYASTYSGVYKTITGGGQWDLSNTGLAAAPAFLAIDPINPQNLYAIQAKDVYASFNGGGTWEFLTTVPSLSDLTLLAVDPHDPSRLYVGTRGSSMFTFGQPLLAQLLHIPLVIR